MKKILALTALLVTGLTASFGQSVLRISLSDNSRFNIALNGRHFDKQGQSITVGDLPPGRQHLKIFALRRNRWGEPVEELVYQGRVNTYIGMTTVMLYDPNTGMVDIQESDMQQNAPRQQPIMPQQDDNMNRDNDNNHDSPATSAYNDAPPQSLSPGSPAASPVAEGRTGTLTDSKIEKLNAKAEAKKTDTEKMKVLKDGLRNEQLTTYDVSLMMDWFLFESSKVDFASWAYNITVDRELYHDLDAKLKNDRSKEELDNFIKAKN